MQPKHATFSASSADRWINCPGSVKLSQQCPPEATPNVYAQEGIDAHLVAYRILDKAVKTGIIDPCNEYILLYVNEVLSNYDPKTDTIMLEKRINLCHLGDNLFGTADCVIVKPNKALVYDFKYGQHVEVSAIENAQLMYYCMLFLNPLKPITNFEICIVQPRLVTGEPIKKYSFDLARLLEFYKEVKRAIQLANTTTEYHLGDWCRFCPAIAICPAQKAKYELLLGSPEQTPTFPPIEGMTPDFIKMVLDNKSKIEKWLKAVSDYAFNQLHQGKDIEGYTLQARRGRLDWTSVVEAELKLTDDTFYSRKLLTPLQIKTRFPEQLTIVDELCSRKIGSVALVRKNDSENTIELDIDRLLD